MTDLTKEQLDQALQRQAETLARILGRSGAGAGGGSSGTGSTRSAENTKKTQEKLDADLNKQIKLMKDNLESMRVKNSSFSDFTRKGYVDSKKRLDTFNKNVYEVDRRLLELDQALNDHNDNTKQLSASQVARAVREREALTAIKKEMDARLAFQDNLRSMGSGIAWAAKSATQFATQAISSAAAVVAAGQAGGTGFQLLGTAYEQQLQLQNQGTKTMTEGANMAGSALMLGGTRAKIAGVAIMGLAGAANMASEIMTQALTTRARILVSEGDKMANAFKDSTRAGALFAGGADGMLKALQGSRITMADYAAIVKESGQAMANSNMSVVGATEQMVRVGKSMKSAGVDQGLMNLGFSFKEQAQLTADVMADMNRSRGGARATDSQVQKAVVEYAKNLTIIADITGEDAKKRMEDARSSANELAFQQKLQGMSVEQQQAMTASMANMTAQQKKDFMETVVFGRIVNKAGAMQAAMMPSYRASVDESARLAKQNKLTADAQEQINAKYQKGIHDEAMGSGMQAVARGGMALGGELQGMSKNVLEQTQFNDKYTQENIAKAKAEADRREKDNNESQDKMGAAFRQAATTVNDFQTKLQGIVADSLPAFITAIKNSTDAMLNAALGIAAPGQATANLMEKLMTLASVVALAALAAGGLGKAFGFLAGAAEKIGLTAAKATAEGAKAAETVGAKTAEATAKTTAEGAKVGEAATGVGAKAAETAGVKAAESSAIKTGAKLLGKALLIGGSAISAYDAYDRTKKGDYTGAAISGASAVVNLIPGFGMFASMGLDAVNMYRDYQKAKDTPEAKAKAAEAASATASQAKAQVGSQANAAPAASVKVGMPPPPNAPAGWSTMTTDQQIDWMVKQKLDSVAGKMNVPDIPNIGARAAADPTVMNQQLLAQMTAMVAQQRNTNAVLEKMLKYST